MYQNPRRLRRPEERVGNVTNADLPPPDDAAFNQLAESLHPAMLRAAMNFVRTPEEAEEVIQDTWVAALRGIHKFEGRSSIKTWIFRILINRARTRAKREARVVPLSSIEAGTDSAGSPQAPMLQLAVQTRTPEDEALDDELRTVLDGAVRKLPRVQRLVLSLRDIEGWSTEEVCSALKISPGHQRVVLHRARMKVRELMRPYF